MREEEGFLFWALPFTPSFLPRFPAFVRKCTTFVRKSTVFVQQERSPVHDVISATHSSPDTRFACPMEPLDPFDPQTEPVLPSAVVQREVDALRAILGLPLPPTPQRRVPPGPDQADLTTTIETTHLHKTEGKNHNIKTTDTPRL